MANRLSITTAFTAFIFIYCKTTLAYDDDDLLCRPGWSPEIYEQQIWQQNNQHRLGMMEYQYAMANAAAEQRSREIAKVASRARREQAARKREEMIAKRKAQNAVKAASSVASSQSPQSTSKP